ncbi:MAG: prolipoprotein diacylglyceryl transferase [Deltaproteobacteria bacterium]|nr:prolipoprotein diacylglyceryl transferase [Deltaproteobacteria bacterium]
MRPILIKLGPIPIHGYGLMIAIGFLISIYVLRKLAARSKLDPEKIVDLAFWCLIIGFLGSRILFAITRFNDFASDPVSFLRIWEGGFVFFGGLLAVIPFVMWYFKKYKLPAWKTVDVLSVGVVLSHAFGRLGCFLAGCCHGKPTGSNWGVKFYSDLVEPALHGINLHPTQLYESSALFLLFFGLLWIFKIKRFDGQVALTYFIVYPIIRSVIEVFRGDVIRGFIIEDVLSTSQFISIFVIIGAVLVLSKKIKQNAH